MQNDLGRFHIPICREPRTSPTGPFSHPTIKHSAHGEDTKVLLQQNCLHRSLRTYCKKYHEVSPLKGSELPWPYSLTQATFAEGFGPGAPWLVFLAKWKHCRCPKCSFSLGLLTRQWKAWDLQTHGVSWSPSSKIWRKKVQEHGVSVYDFSQCLFAHLWYLLVEMLAVMASCLQVFNLPCSKWPNT